MITLCVDVGVRNLSLCIMTSAYEILFWQVVDILDMDDHRCDHHSCDRPAALKFPGTTDGAWKFTCKRHRLQGIEGLPHKKKVMSDYPLATLVRILLDRLESIYDSHRSVFDPVNAVYIELQPQRNPKSVLLSHVLYTRFIQMYNIGQVSVKFISGTRKLQCYTGPPMTCTKTGYAKRKWLSVHYCQWFLEHQFPPSERDRWLPHFQSYSKADDAADSFLYAVYIIQSYRARCSTPAEASVSKD